MNAHCTCGSPLPEGAQFCPQCGRPLWPGAGQPADSPEVSWETPVSGREKAASPGFQALLRAAVMPATAAILLRFFLGVLSPLLNLLSFAFFLGAGFAAVRNHERRHSTEASVGQGCALGALTGAVCVAISWAAQAAILAALGGSDAFIERIHRETDTMPWASEFSSWLENPAFVAMLFAVVLVVEALFTLAFSTAGGALAARIRRTVSS